MKKLYLITIILLLIIVNTQAQSMRDTVSREDKLYALSKIWKEADYNFVFFDKQPGFNWDSLYTAYIPKILATRNTYEYFKVLRSFISTLKDGHTAIWTSQYFWNEIDSPPVDIVKNLGKRYVVSLDESLKKDIPIGSELIRLNGKTWEEFLAGTDLENNDWYGFQNTLIELTLLTPDKKTIKATVKRNRNALFRNKTIKMFPATVNSVAAPKFEYRSLSPQTAYVAINTFDESIVVNNFRDALPEIRKHKNLIVDIRNNGGGKDDNAIQIAEYLTDKPYMVSSIWKERANTSAHRAWATFANKLQTYTDTSWIKHPSDTIKIPANFERLNLPVYILTSKNTGSAAEDFVIYLLGSKNIKTIGQTTAGSSGQPLKFKIPKNFEVRICSKRDALPGGADFIGIGIKPNVYVEPFFSLKGEVKDLELQKALEIISANPE